MPDHMTTQTPIRVFLSKDTSISLHKEPLILRRRVTITSINTEETLTATPSTKKIHQEIAEGSRSPISRGHRMPTLTLVILNVVSH
jgi:archaellum biogenesis ATPase FlaH